MKLMLRPLLKSPGFTFVALATLALCIGANSAIFSVVNAILLKPYPWPDSDRLVYVHNVFPKIGTSSRGGMSIPDYLDHRAGVSAFAESALIAGFNANLSGDGPPERVYGLSVTPSVFALLQTPPLLGRAFTEAEAEPGAPKTVVLRHELWRTRFGADPAAVGRTVRFNGEPYTIVGVMPPGFYFPSLRAQLFVPYAFTAAQKSEAQRITQFSSMIARLKPGATLDQAQRELDSVHRAARERLPNLKTEYAATGYGSLVTGFLETNVQDVRAMLWLLQAGVAAALLIGCANVANLLLARATARQREFAIRAALGASRGRLIRQLLGESLVLFLVGGALGLVVAIWGLGAVNSLGLESLPRGFAVALDARVFAFTFLSALVAGLGFGTLPAWSATRSRAVDALKAAGGRATAGRQQLSVRSGLVVVQIALSLMLLATAGLLLKSFARVQDESPGFTSERVLTALLTLPPARYAKAEQRALFASQITERIAAIPGVATVGLTNSLPFGIGNPQGGYQIAGREPPQGQPNPNGMMRQVSPGYFATMGIPLLRGRLLDPSDVLGREHVLVVDEFAANRHWPGRDPIGEKIIHNPGGATATTWTIVGVVGSVKHWDLEAPVNKETLYFPYAQQPNPTVGIVIKASPAFDASTLATAVRQAVLAVDPEQPVFDVKALEARIDESLQRRRAPMVLLTTFAAVALLLAALGIYGVLAFSVGQRTNEIGIRMALGADRPAILAMILRQGALLVAFGLALGVGGYFAASRLIGAQLYRVGPTDPAALIAAPLILAVVALLACLLPARRATRIDPITALRAE